YNLVNRYKFGFFDHEDIFQSTMIKALQRAETFKSDGVLDAQEVVHKVDAWLGGIAQNVVFDLLRRKPNCVPLDPVFLNGDADEEGTEIECPQSQADEETNEIKLIREAIDTLSPAEQAVIWASNQFNECREHQRTPTEELKQIVTSLGI